MKKIKLSIYPPYQSKLSQGNPFVNNLHDSISDTFIHEYDYDTSAILSLIKHTFTTDIYILNWIENVVYWKFGLLRYFLVKILLQIMVWRGVKIIWFFHNIIPHQGENNYTKKIYKFLMRHSALIVALSKDGYRYLETVNIQGKIMYSPHPFKKELLAEISNFETKKYDILIWGAISKYKGVVEFLQYLKAKALSDEFKILIVGRCKDPGYSLKLKSLLGKNIEYRNEYINDEELKVLISQSKYVLFPYLKGSVSSSGALMDSIEYGATVIGPNFGAFKDMKEENVTFVYDDYSGIVEIIKSTKSINKDKARKFVEDNIWDKFGDRLSDAIVNLYK